MSQGNERYHVYHAEALVLKGNLSLPLVQEINPQAHAKLSPEGGYLSQSAQDYKLEQVISYSSAYTQVAGNPDTKPGHGWSTLVTSVVEGLNVLDVLTADRVVGQISTEHPLEGYVPHVSFLGTRFDNLRIAGHPVKLHLDLDIFGDKPQGDAPYTGDPGFIGRVSSQYERIRAVEDPPAEVLKRYNQVPAGDALPASVECSLVNSVEGSFPGSTCGHVITIPNFGTIYLATLRLEHETYTTETGTHISTIFDLTMIDLKLGCLAAGTAQMSRTITNGTSRP